MSKPIIGIVGRENLSQVDNRSVMSTGDQYRRAVIKAGGIPLSVLPTQDIEYPHYGLEDDKALNNEEKNDLISILDKCDGFILPGGCKIFYYDKFITKYALDNNKPILGICLGMQILAATDCEDEIVINKIDEEIEHPYQDKFVHKVKISKDSKLYSILEKEEFMVNSRHRCNVIKTNKFDVVGFSDDGIIEAIERKDKNFAIGVQWHPEMIFDESEESRKLFKSFINSMK